jgi:hypothetical protein
MTPLQDKLRAALRETADEIPPEAPPLRLSPGRRTQNGTRPAWRAWAAPLAAAALVVAVIAASVTLAGGLKPQPSTPGASAGPAGPPPYYVALTTQKPDSDVYDLGATAAEIRSTRTGAVLARVAPPRPYVSFTGVTGAADDRTFVLSAQGPYELSKNMSALQYRKEYPNGYYPAQRFFLLRIDPGAPPGARMSLTALPASYTPANDAIHDMALSPDGTTLAADVGGELFNDSLYTFNLATGAERSWNSRSCPRCFPSSGGLGYGGVNVDALSWTGDSHHVAFVWGGTVRLLDTRAPGSDLVTDSKPVANWTPSQTVMGMWRGAIITPDGRTVLGIEELGGPDPNRGIPEHLVRFSTATGKQTAILNNLDAVHLNGYEQILYTNATGSTLVVTYLRPGRNATILQDGRSTPIPWSPYIGVAAW